MLGSAELDDDRGIWSDWPGKFDAHVFFLSRLRRFTRGSLQKTEFYVDKTHFLK